MKAAFMFMMGLIMFMNSLGAQTESQLGACSEGWESLYEKVIDDKLYLKPGTLVITTNAIYHLVGDQLIPLDYVAVDGEGVFTYPTAYPYGTCWACGFLCDRDGVCTNRYCITKWKKK